MVEPSSVLSTLRPSPRERRRLVRGVKYGLLGAILFIVSLTLVFIAFELASPFIAEGAEYIVESETVESAKTYVTNSAIYERIVG
jgi:hypothetical protein